MAIQNPPHKKTVLPPLDVLRSETVLSRYPIHQLSKKDSVEISIERKNENDQKSFSWRVGYNSLHGPPRTLAYKLDKFVINRRIDECQKPIPQILRIGTFREIAKELNLGAQTNKAKEAFRQNASAFIEAKFEYINKFGKKEWFISADTRYGLYERGMELPNGEVAEEVYIVLHDAFLRILNEVETRPLDYDYLKSLTPIGSRWYELISFKMYGSLKHKQDVKILYSEFCAAAPQRRYSTYDKVKKQMYKVHTQHIKADYIMPKVKFVRTIDRNGNVDWEMHYQPGEKAIEEFLAFQGKRTNTSIGKPGKGKTDVVSEASELVKYFYTRFHNAVDVKPNKRSELQALRLLEKHGVEKSRFIIDFVHQSLAKQPKEFKPDHFGFVLKYVEHAIAVYDEHVVAEQRKVEEEAQRRRELLLEQMRQRYDEYKEEELVKIKDGLPRNEFEKMASDVRQEVENEGGPAFTWDSMTKFRLENKLAEQANIPTFEEWSEQLEIV